MTQPGTAVRMATLIIIQPPLTSLYSVELGFGLVSRLRNEVLLISFVTFIIQIIQIFCPHFSDKVPQCVLSNRSSSTVSCHLSLLSLDTFHLTFVFVFWPRAPSSTTPLPHASLCHFHSRC